MRTDLFAIFTKESDANIAIRALLAEGAKSADVSTLNRHVDAHDAQVALRAFDEIEHSPLESYVEPPSEVDKPGLDGLPTGSLAVTALPGIGIVGGQGPFAMAMIAAVSDSDAEVTDIGIRGYLARCRIDDGLAKRIHDAYERNETIVSVCVPSGSLSVERAQAVLNEYGVAVQGAGSEGAPVYGRTGL